MRSKDHHHPKSESSRINHRERLRRDGGRGDRKIDSFYAIRNGDNRMSDAEIIAESGSLSELQNKLNALDK